MHLEKRSHPSRPLNDGAAHDAMRSLRSVELSAKEDFAIAAFSCRYGRCETFGDPSNGLIGQL